MSDFKNYSRLQEEQEKTLKNCNEMIEKWEKFKKDYQDVDKLLNDLPKKTRHDIMVPIGPLAFMPGQLIHTNEIMVLLGDNWFAERSAVQAVDIAKRRLNSVEEYLSKLHKEHENILSHMSFTQDIGAQNDFQEIKEELTEEDKQRRDRNSKRVAHAKATKHSVKRIDLRGNSCLKTKTKDEENLFERLEELEKLESVNKELENEEYFTCDTNVDANAETYNENTKNETRTRTSSKAEDGGAGDKNSKYLLNEQQSETSRLKRASFDDERVVNASSKRNVQNDFGNACIVDGNQSVKKVSWKQNIVENQQEVGMGLYKGNAATIHFTHSASRRVADGEAKQRHENSITSPADIFAQYLATKKKTTYQDSQSAQINSTEEQSLTANVPEHKMPKAFSDIIVERADADGPNSCANGNNGRDKEQKIEPRKMSKFKAGRMKSR